MIAVKSQTQFTKYYLAWCGKKSLFCGQKVPFDKRCQRRVANQQKEYCHPNEISLQQW